MSKLKVEEVKGKKEPYGAVLLSGQIQVASISKSSGDVDLKFDMNPEDKKDATKELEDYAKKKGWAGESKRHSDAAKKGKMKKEVE
jgi:hypothetical protein